MRRVRGWGIGIGVLCMGVLCICCGAFSASSDAPGTTTTTEDAGTRLASDAMSSDSGTASDEASVPPPACPAGAFCDGFERSADELVGPWKSLDTGNADLSAYTATIDNGHVHTGARAFHVGISVSAQAGGPELELERSAQGTTQAHLTFSFFSSNVARHVNLVHLDLDGDLRSVLVIGAELQETTPSLFVGRQKDFDDGGSAYQGLSDSIAPKLDPSGWNDVIVDVDYSNATPTFVVTLNGQPLVLESPDLDVVHAVSKLTVGCGLNYAQIGPAIDVWYDDVQLVTQ